MSSCFKVSACFELFDQKARLCGFAIASMHRTESIMTKYGKSAQRSVKRAMHKLKDGSLKSGKSDTRVNTDSKPWPLDFRKPGAKGERYLPNKFLTMAVGRQLFNS